MQPGGSFGIEPTAGQLGAGDLTVRRQVGVAIGHNLDQTTDLQGYMFT
jgi:hypothetical protein